MANPFVRGWKYFLAMLSGKLDEKADPKIQIQQAIEEAQRQHQALTQQAAAVIGNQRQLEMKLSRQMSEVETLNWWSSPKPSTLARAKPDHCSDSDVSSLSETGKPLSISASLLDQRADPSNLTLSETA